MASTNRFLFMLKNVTANERGSVMSLALLFLMLLSIIVFAGSKTSSVDIKIASNKKEYDRNFYLAEGVTTQMVRVLENTRATDVENLKDSDRPGWPNGLVKQDQLANETSVVDADWAANSVSQNWPDIAVWQGSNPCGSATPFRYIAVDEGVVDDGSLSVLGSRTYKYNARGLAQCNSGVAEISVGYKIRF